VGAKREAKRNSAIVHGGASSMTETKTEDALAAVVGDIVKEQNELEKALPLIGPKRGRKKQKKIEQLVLRPETEHHQ
jgi:hypothetical protein